MPKRRTESTSSSSSDWESSESSVDDPSLRSGSGVARMMKKSPKGALDNGKGSRKRACNGSAVSEQRGTSLVASTSAQLHRDLGLIVKEESEESEVEHSSLTVSPPERMDRACSSSAAAQQSTPEERDGVPSKARMTSEDATKPTPSKKVPVFKPRKKYFEGCLVMAWYNNRGYPWWPAIIRKARGETANAEAGYKKHTGSRGRISFCVQYFTSPAYVVWRLPKQLKVFNPGKPYRCNHPDPSVVARFEKRIQIAKAAANFSMKARLAKFTLPKGGGIDKLLREMETGQLTPENDSLAHDEVGLAPPAQRNKPSITEMVAEFKKQAALLKKKDLEREEAHKALTRKNSKLTAELKKVKASNRDLTRQLQSKSGEEGKVESLKRKLKNKDKLIEELRKDKQGCIEELEKMRSEVESLQGVFDGATST